jgi:hypothetical protein
MENKAGMVKEACILKVQHEGNQQLQRFYITDLGFDRILLGYPWLSTFNPRIDWKTGTVEGETNLKTIGNAWERWKEVRQQGLVAHVSMTDEEKQTIELELEDTEWCVVARTNFAQEWAREAKQRQTSEVRLPDEYKRHKIIFDENAAKRFPPSWPEDHAIRLKPGAPSEINCKIYPLTKQELEATRKFLDENLKLGYIEESDPSKPEGVPWSTPWFFTGKKDGGL